MSSHSFIKTVPDSSDVAVTASGVIQHRCPHVDEDDHGRVDIKWRVNGETLELHSLAAYLQTFRDCEISHEQLTNQIRFDLSLVAQIELVSVETHWNTAGMEVRCSTSPTRAEVAQ